VEEVDKKSTLISEMIKYYAGDVKRINHFLKVHSFAKTIGEMEGLEASKQEILEVSAIVHDIGIKISEEKYNSSAGNYQEIEGPAIAEELLKSIGFSDSIINRVSFLVGHHHTYGAIDDLDFQILVEADFLVNIYEDSFEEAAIKQVEGKYFKTATGKTYIKNLYL
jgi:predicted metal-dependent HD superfamily phosphohydrolase